MADITNTKTVVELEYKYIALASYLMHSDLDGNAFKFKFSDIITFLNGVYATKEEMTTALAQLSQFATKGYVDSKVAQYAKTTYVDAKDAEIMALINGINKGSLNVYPTDSPSNGIDVYNALVAGTYTNFGGFVVTPEEIGANLVRFVRRKGVWEKILVAIPLTGFAPVFSNDLNSTISGKKLMVSTGSDGKLHLSNILDQYTGELITATETTDTEDADNILYWSYGSKKFKRDFTSLDPVSFGAKGDGLAEDTAALHTMLLKLKDGYCVDWGNGDRKYNFDTINLVGVRYVKFIGSGAMLNGTIIIGDTDPLATGMTYGFTSEGMTFNHTNGTRNCYEVANARGVYINNTIIPTSLIETETRYTNAVLYIRPLDKFQHVNRVSIKNTHGRGNYLVYADNPIKTAPYTGIKMSLGDIEVSGNADFQSEITCFLGFGVDGATISDNTFFMSGYTDKSQKKNQNIRIVASNWVKISSNSFFESGLEGVLLEKSTNFNVNNNNFAWSGQRDVNFGYGIRVTGSGYPDAAYTTGIINNNVFALPSRTAIKLDAKCARVIVCDNQGMAIANPVFYYGNGALTPGDPATVPAINSVPHYMVDVDADTRYCSVHDNNGDNAPYNFPYDASFLNEARAQLTHSNNNGGSGVQEHRNLTLNAIVAETINVEGTDNVQINVGAGNNISNISGMNIGDVVTILVAGSPITFKNSANIQMANEVDGVIPFRGTITFQKRAAKIYELSRTAHYKESVDNFKWTRPRLLSDFTSVASNFDLIFNSTRAGLTASVDNNNQFRVNLTMNTDGKVYTRSSNNGIWGTEKKLAFDKQYVEINASAAKITRLFSEILYNTAAGVNTQTLGYSSTAEPGTTLDFVNPSTNGNNLVIVPDNSGANIMYINDQTGSAGTITLLPGQKLTIILSNVNNYRILYIGKIDTR